MRYLPFLIVLLFTGGEASQSTKSKTFWQDHARGWHWYEPVAIPKEEKPQEDKDKAGLQPQTATEKIQAYREELENRLAMAWLHPTTENVQRYQEMQKDMMQRSQSFSETWMHNVYTNAGLDHTLVSPVNQKAVHVYLDEQKEEQRQLIKSLSRTHGLFFFYANKCPYCHKFAPIVKLFSEKYGWEVLAISLDGGEIGEFPNAVPDNGLAQQWNVTILPSLFAVNPETEEVVQVAQGMTGIDEMENRITALAGERR